MKTIQTALLAVLALAALAALNLLRYRTHGADYIDAYLRRHTPYYGD